MCWDESRRRGGTEREGEPEPEGEKAGGKGAYLRQHVLRAVGLRLNLRSIYAWSIYGQRYRIYGEHMVKDTGYMVNIWSKILDIW